MFCRAEDATPRSRVCKPVTTDCLILKGFFDLQWISSRVMLMDDGLKREDVTTLPRAENMLFSLVTMIGAQFLLHSSDRKIQ